MDDYGLTPEEVQLYFQITRERIRNIEAKAYHRLLATEEEKELFRLINKLQRDSEFREIAALLLIAGS
jgi:DNA-directed RNA polymerase sigma subunit (sigma70/sigma32)